MRKRDFSLGDGDGRAGYELLEANQYMGGIAGRKESFAGRVGDY